MSVCICSCETRCSVATKDVCILFDIHQSEFERGPAVPTNFFGLEQVAQINTDRGIVYMLEQYGALLRLFYAGFMTASRIFTFFSKTEPNCK